MSSIRSAVTESVGLPEETHPSAAEIIALYQRIAVRFDRERGKGLFEKVWLDRFVDALGGDRRVLDLGCGSGEPIARYLIEQGCQITGIDTAPQMLTLCRTRFPEHRWIEADMRSWSSRDTFDGILAWNSFFHLSRADQRRMFGRFSALAKPGAALMFTCGPGNGEAIGEMAGSTLFHASLARDEYETLMHSHGFQPLLFIAEDPDCNRHCVWLARKNSN